MPPSLLETDGYKFSMAEAGFPLRRETFHYTHRKGGWQLVPLDVARFVREALPVPTDEDWAYLDRHGYLQGGGYRAAILRRDAVRVDAIPQGAWFFAREPVFSVTGPSALASWLEPLALQLSFRIQVATAAALGTLPSALTATCDRERELILATVDAVGGRAPTVTVEPDRYHDAVLARAEALVAVVGDGDRLFEVGMRAVSCAEQHAVALAAIRDAGIRRTSNVGLARALGMVPVGTMGHEHVQRHGTDAAAFTAMRDRYPGFVFYLPDTFDTARSGIPAALDAIADAPDRSAGIRFDSEHDIEAHWTLAVTRCRARGLTPILGLESGWNEALTRRFEALRVEAGWPADRQAYGYGGYLVSPPWPTFRRDDVSAVYKISDSGGRATMKFGDEPNGGKSSLPGRPVLWRPPSFGEAGPVGIVAQDGELVPDAERLTGGDAPPITPDVVRRWTGGPVTLSAETRTLVARCTAARAAALGSAT
ncbi:MAG: nicotinate phosphoribosyltransferase [Myxococcota bacterium]